MAFISFCGLLTLQVGCAIMSTVFFIIAALTFGLNVFDYTKHAENSWPIDIFFVCIFVALMCMAGTLTFIAAYRESRRICFFALLVMLLLMLYWLTLTTIALANRPTDFRRVCVEHRCAATFWLASLNYRARPERTNVNTTRAPSTAPTEIYKNEKTKATTPKATTPKATTPKETTPNATTPKATTPKATTPNATTPKATTPNATTPKATTPKETTPNATTPNATTPKATTPNATTPKATTPKATTPKATTLKATTQASPSTTSTPPQSTFESTISSMIDDVTSEKPTDAPVKRRKKRVLSNHVPERISDIENDYYKEEYENGSEKFNWNSEKSPDETGEVFDAEPSNYVYGSALVGSVIFALINLLFFVSAIIIVWSYAQELKWDSHYYNSQTQ